MIRILDDTYVLVKDTHGNIIMPDDLKTLNIIRAILAYKVRDNEDIYFEDNDTWYSYNERKESFLGKLHTVISLKNITKYKKKIESLSLDAVTGILTRETTERLFHDYLNHSVHNNEPFVLIMADLDNFKIINDTFGHYVGDAVLHHVAQTLKDKIRHNVDKSIENERESDIVGRFGGDEFIIVLKNIDYNTAIRRTEEIRQAIESIEFEKAGVHIQSDTISLGLAYIGPETIKEYVDNVEGLRILALTKADAALYDSKKSGRNKLTTYTLK